MTATDTQPALAAAEDRRLTADEIFDQIAERRISIADNWGRRK